MTVLEDDRSALALQALAEVTDPASVGELIDLVEPAPGVRDLIFACRLPGYVAWRWTVSTAQVGDAEPTVLEVALLPGDGALVAPPWVPWAERLAEYRRTHPDEGSGDGEGSDEETSDESDDDIDDEDLDDEDLDDEDPDALEIDGVEFEEPSDDDAEDPGDGELAEDDRDGEDEAVAGDERVGRP